MVKNWRIPTSEDTLMTFLKMFIYPEKKDKITAYLIWNQDPNLKNGENQKGYTET